MSIHDQQKRLGELLLLYVYIVLTICVVSFSREFLIMLMYFLCFGARDIVVMQSVTKFRP